MEVITCPQCGSDDIGITDHNLSNGYEKRAEQLQNRRSFFNTKTACQLICIDCEHQFLYYGSPAQAMRQQKIAKAARDAEAEG